VQVRVNTLTDDSGRDASPVEAAAAPGKPGAAPAVASPALDNSAAPTTSFLRPAGRTRLSFSRLYAWHLKPFVWRLFHPGGTPEEYYARSIAGRVERGDHPAIGAQARSVRAPTELLDILLTHGLKPEHVVVDFGCGSFRLGKALIQYLVPGHYWGLDVIDAFLASGMALLGPELAAEKRPNPRVISDANLAETAAAKPDFIVSWHVCSKVPPSRLDDYFGKIVGLMGPRSLALVHFPESAQRLRQSRFSWSESREAIAAALRQLDPSLDVRFTPITEQVIRGVRQTMVEIRRKA
jgi:hypothetical protein